MKDPFRRSPSKPQDNAVATPAEGLALLLWAEGGCVSVIEACPLLQSAPAITPRMITDLITKGEILAYLPVAGGEYRVPVWQFMPEGGVLRGLKEVLAVLRAGVAGATGGGERHGQLVPFAFLLQAEPILGGTTPLSMLRKREITAVLTAAEAYVR